jgi:hypothetical protein
MMDCSIALMDTFQKIQGTMTAGLYTMLGSYYTLQALMGAIIELIIKILVSGYLVNLLSALNFLLIKFIDVGLYTVM